MLLVLSMQFDMHDQGIHLEITSNCNSRCLDCQRFVQGTDEINPFIEVGSAGLLDKMFIDNIFDTTVSQNARYINFTGTYGDFILHPDCHTIVDKIADNVNKFSQYRLKNKLTEKLRFMCETNGGLHDEKWWTSLCKIIKQKYDKTSVIVFALDGVDDDTHQLYRRGVNFDKVIENAKTCIASGVRCVWSFIAFEHNEHQIEKAKAMAKQLGFHKFKIIRSRLRHNTNKIKIDNLSQKKKNINKEDIKTISQYAELVIPEDKQIGSEYPNKPWYKRSVKENINSTEIECEWFNKRQISIDYTGRVWQCCYFSTFYHYPIQPHESKEYDWISDRRDYERLSHYENQYADDWNNVKFHTLSAIMDHRFFTNDLNKSFDNTTFDKKFPRIVRCGKHCGSETRSRDEKLMQVNKQLESIS